MRIGRECVCLGLRRASRAVSRRYDEALKTTGITSGQFSILTALLATDGLPLGKLADVIGLDRTTLTRNLALLERMGLVMSATDGKDQRVRGLSLTPKGRSRLEQAIPLWAQAQAVSNSALESARWEEMRRVLRRLD